MEVKYWKLSKHLSYFVVLLAVLSICHCALLNQCYTSGGNCIKFQKGNFEFVDTVQLTGDNVPTLKANSTTSTRIVLSELLSHLAFNHSWTLAALVVNAGTRKNVQWKISPDNSSEHQIEIQDADGYNSVDANVTIHCIDIQNYADDAKRVLVVPPDYQFFFSTNGTTDNCGESGLSLIPFVWDTSSRGRIKGMSYFYLTDCNDTCSAQPVPPLLVRFCPNTQNKEMEIRIDKVDDFIVELSDDLLGFNIQRVNKSIQFPIGIMNCSTLMDNSDVLGENPVCLGDGENIAVKFGANPKIEVAQEVTTKYSLRSAFLKSAKNPVYPNFTVSHEKEVATCSNATKFEVKQISGNGFMPLHFQWSILNGSVDMEKMANATSDRLLEVPRQHLSTKNLLVVTGCNLAGMCTSSEPISTDLVEDASIFSVAIDGYEQETPASFGLRLHANPTFQQCSSKTSPKDVQYEWKLNGEGQMYDDALKLPAYSYSVDDVVNITLVARYKNEKSYSSSITKTIHYFALPLLVSLDCVERQVGKDHDLVVRVLAVDQNKKDSSLNYKWSCTIINGNNGSQTCDVAGVKINEESLRIPSAKLVQNAVMNISATVSTEEQSKSSSCLVTVGTTQIPTIAFFRLAEKKQNIFDFIRIQAQVSTVLPTLNVTWEIVRDSQFGFFNISSVRSSPTTIIPNVPAKTDVFVSLTIPPPGSQYPSWPGLSSGKTYVVRLWATNEKGTSFADLHLLTNSPPTTGAIDISSTTIPPVALETPVTFAVGDGWNDDKDDLPLSYQFGYRIHYDDNRTYEYWGSRSTAKSQQFFLPSTTGGNNSEECGDRVGISALLSVCDRLGSCSAGQSGIFVVEQSKNISLASMDLIRLLNADVGNANLIAAIAKINILNIELCTENFDQSQTDKITMLLFQSLYESEESEEFKEALRAASSLLPVVSSDILTELIHVLSYYRQLTLQGFIENSGTRKKRSTEEASTQKVYKATESEANDMLKVYDILIGKDKPVIDVFFLNINDFLTGFCVQLDENSNEVMSAVGSGYTTIQTQSVNVNLQKYTGKFNISDPDSKPNITFSSYFASTYSSWNCSTSSNSTCQYVCLGTAWISQTAMADNSYLADALFLDQYDLTINKSVSNLHQLSLVDPISGVMLTPSNGQVLYSVELAVFNYKPINYYNCFIYNQNTGWGYRQCASSTYAKTVQGQNFITCNCSATGIVGVFLVNAPPPDPLPDHNEILLSLLIDSEVTADDLVKIFARIAVLAEVDQKRFVKISNKGNKTIMATLRPPFRVDQKSNSIAVQSIQKAVGYQKILNVITVLNFTYSVVKRDLNGDANARKVTFNFLKSYLTQLGSDGDDYARKWALTIAATLQISEYRFKNYKIFFGVVYNITVTLPFTDEPKPLAAEEISLMIQECSKYGEFDFQLSDESVSVGVIADSDLTKLLVMHETNSLMLALVVVLSIILGLGTIFICGAVLVKLRTDKLIVEERRRANLKEQFQLPPPIQYSNPNTTPFHVVTDQYPIRRQRNEVSQY